MAGEPGPDPGHNVCMGVRGEQVHDQKWVAVTIGRAIQEALNQRGLSQNGMGDLIGVDPGTLNRYIQGHRDPAQPGYRKMLARIDEKLDCGLIALHDGLTGYQPGDERALSPAGQMIYTRMRERGLTQTQLCQVSRVSAHNLSGIMSGRRGPGLPTYAPQLVTLARTLDLDATELLAAGGIEGEAATIALMAAIIATAPDELAALNAELAGKLKAARGGVEHEAQADRIFDSTS